MPPDGFVVRSMALAFSLRRLVTAFNAGRLVAGAAGALREKLTFPSSAHARRIGERNWKANVSVGDKSPTQKGCDESKQSKGSRIYPQIVS